MTAPPIISRGDAKRAGLNKYFTGKPCRRGHVAERYAAGGHCETCHADDGRASEARRKPGKSQRRPGWWKGRGRVWLSRQSGC